jgi:hypothetical protein
LRPLMRGAPPEHPVTMLEAARRTIAASRTAPFRIAATLTFSDDPEHFIWIFLY